MSSFWNQAPPAPTTLHGHLGAIVAAISHKLGVHLITNRHLQPVLALVHYYLCRAVPRLERLIARWKAGQSLTTRSRTPQAKAEPTARPARLRLPSRQGWLLHLVQPTAQHRPTLQRLLDMPEMLELLAAAPQAGRILRPLFRMLAIPLPEILRLPPRPPRPRAKPAASFPRIAAQERRIWQNPSPGRLGETHRRIAALRQKRAQS